MCTEPVRLCYNLPIGIAARYTATSTLGQNLNVMGRDVISEVKTQLGLTLSVNDKLMKSSSVQIAWTDAQLQTRTIGQKANEQADSTFRIPTYGITQQLIITPNGTIVSSTASQSAQQSEVLAMLKSTRIPDRLILPFPTDVVKPGARWEAGIADTSAAPQGRGSVVTSGTVWYTYRGITDTLGNRCWVIELTSANLEQHGVLYGAAIEMHINGTGSLHGISFHDTRTGLLVCSATNLETQVLMTSNEQNISVPVRSQVSVAINREESKGW